MTYCRCLLFTAVISIRIYLILYNYIVHNLICQHLFFVFYRIIQDSPAAIALRMFCRVAGQTSCDPSPFPPPRNREGCLS